MKCSTPSPPLVSQIRVNLFTRYARWYVRRHFRSVRVSGDLVDVPEGPLIVYLNHASWWDPLICLLLRERFLPGRESYAPMDSAVLETLPFFKKLGFFGVAKGTKRAATQFVSAATAILNTPETALWVTAQGDFADPRLRPAGLKHGVGFLASKLKDVPVTFLPIAIEYPFWLHRLPEVCVRIGEPFRLHATHTQLGTDAITAFLDRKLVETQEDLARLVIRRDSERLRPLYEQEVGVGGVYGLWQRARALFRSQEVTSV